MTAITDIAAVGAWVRDAGAIAVLSGAGMSAESGVPTFRDAQTGLWAKFRPEELATEAAFRADPRRVWDWYASRREMMKDVHPTRWAVSNPSATVRAYWMARESLVSLFRYSR
jgi:NAD-dependent SIR2 family protein deacetylase